MKNVVYYYCIVIASLLLFLYGFFPVQQNQTINPIHLPEALKDIKFNISQLYKQDVTRLVLVVVDALRLDFITEENMPFLASAYPTHGCLLTLRVESPTVTLPRIKALTTGSIPQFSDVIFNLASTEILKDSLLHRARDAGKKIVFYGDDMWIKLYPNMFERFEGVTSFYVSDYTEVDNNVTRNVVKELNNADWDIMLLHYLGLDHIGHVFGPYSQLVQPKLREMDSIIKNIYQLSNDRGNKTLIAVTGDHGMKDSGGHGGSTASETYVPFISLGIPCRNASVVQTDIPSTLATLMGLPHPADSIGRVISDMLVTFTFDRLLYVLHYNSLFLHAKMEQFKTVLDEASMLHYSFLKLHKESDATRAKKLYEEYTNKASDKLLHSSVNQDFHSLLIGSALLINCFCVIFYDFVRPDVVNKKVKTVEQVYLTTLLASQLIMPNLGFLTIVHLFVISIFVLRYIILIIKAVRWNPKCDIDSYLVFGTIMHVVSLLSSSFIEEEHQVWYFFCGTFLLIYWYLAAAERRVLSWMLLFLGMRLLRNINQTGDKWAHLPDLSQWLLLQENYYYLQVLFCIGLILTWLCCISFQGKQKFTIVLNTTTLVLIYVFHFSSVNNLFLVKLIWFAIILNLSLGLIQGKLENVIVAWIICCTLLMRPYNVILLPACVYASFTMCKYIKGTELLTIIHIWLGKMLFFCQGHSNSLASIDVASGYVGLQEYIPFMVVIQVLCHTYAFPVLVTLMLVKNSFLYVDTVWTINIICQLLVLTVMCLLILIQRHHLFVWTVFAPKLLIESCHTAVLFIQIIFFYCVITAHQVFVKFIKNGSNIKR